MKITSIDAQSTISANGYEGLWDPCIEYIHYEIPSNFQMEQLSGNQQIDLERLASGLYFVKVHSEEGNNTFKILKK